MINCVKSDFISNNPFIILEIWLANNKISVIVTLICHIILISQRKEAFQKLLKPKCKLKKRKNRIQALIFLDKGKKAFMQFLKIQRCLEDYEVIHKGEFKVANSASLSHFQSFFTTTERWKLNCFFKFYLFIYLAAPGLTCSVRALSCGIRDLVPWPGIEPGPPALGAWSLNHWTTREVPKIKFIH